MKIDVYLLRQQRDYLLTLVTSKHKDPLDGLIGLLDRMIDEFIDTGEVCLETSPVNREKTKILMELQSWAADNDFSLPKDVMSVPGAFRFEKARTGEDPCPACIDHKVVGSTATWCIKQKKCPAWLRYQQGNFDS